MKPIDKNELYEHLSSFFKAKGIELKEGSYTHGIQKSCSLLTDAINMGQRGLGTAKVKLDQKLEQVREVIHEKTAPKPPPAKAAAAKPPPAPAASASAKPATAKKPARSKAKKVRR
jgi:hypothetical protein